MEFLDDHPFDSCSSIKVEEKAEPGNLLEQGWFFGNFLDKKTKMSRCYSDPSPSSNPTQEMLVAKSYEKDIQSSSSSPSLKKKTSTTKDHKGRGSLRLTKSNSRTNGLVRAPSLPPYIGKVEVDFEEDDDDEESEFTMGRLIRQASLNLSHNLPPPSSSKVMKQSGSIPRQQPRRKQENVETITNKTRSRDDLEMGFNFEKLNLNPGPGRIESGHEEERDEYKRSYNSEAWLGQSSAVPSLPNWGVDKKNSSKDMKAQIKFWARAVASNVRQEC